MQDEYLNSADFNAYGLLHDWHLFEYTLKRDAVDSLLVVISIPMLFIHFLAVGLEIWQNIAWYIKIYRLTRKS